MSGSTLRTIQLGEAIEVHCDHIDRYGGQAGIRHTGALKHATGQRPLHIDAFTAAAGYVLDFMTARPFPDANARVGLVTALVFLDLNGVTIDCTDQELLDIVEGVRDRSLGATKLAAFFTSHQCPADRPRDPGASTDADAAIPEAAIPAVKAADALDEAAVKAQEAEDAADEAEELADEAFDEMEERNAALDQPTAPPAAELPLAGERKERLTEMAQFFREDEDEGDARDDG
jgi:death-on-curing protein